MGWNGSGGSGRSAAERRESTAKTAVIPSGNLFRRGLLAFLIVVAGGVIALWLVSGDEGGEQPKTERKHTQSLRIQETSPQTIKSTSPVVAKVVKDEPKSAWREEYMKSTEMRLKFGILLQARTNDYGMVTERYRLPNGQTWRRVIDPPPLFKNRCDQAIMLALGDASGAPIPPVPGLDDVDLDAEFAKGAQSPIEIKDDDKPEVAALKLAVREARAEISEMIKSGDKRSVGEILQDHINLNNHVARMHTEALLQIEKVRREEGDEFAADYKKKVNESFRNCGIPPLNDGLEDESEGGQNVDE